MEPINIGVVIINYNSAKHLIKAIQALSKQTYMPTEVIVFDNGSVEKIPDNINSFGIPIKLIYSPENLGFAGGNNQAINHLDSTVNWIALLNPDAYPEENWLSEMVSAIRTHPEFSFFGSKLICEDAPDFLDGTGDAYHISGKAWRINHQKPNVTINTEIQEVFSPCAAAALYRRDVFLAAKGFDDNYFCYYEDIDLAFRLRLLGYRCGYVPNAIAAHTGSATTKRHSEFYTYHGHRNLTWTYFKNMPLPLLLLTLPLHILLTLASIFLISRRGQLSTLLKAKFDAIKGFKTIINQRKEWQKKRVVSSIAIFKVLHKGLPW